MYEEYNNREMRINMKKYWLHIKHIFLLAFVVQKLKVNKNKNKVKWQDVWKRTCQGLGMTSPINTSKDSNRFYVLVGRCI